MTIEFVKHPDLKLVNGADASVEPSEDELRAIGEELLQDSGLDYNEVAADLDFSREVREEWMRRRVAEAERCQLIRETNKAKALAAARTQRAANESARQAERVRLHDEAEAAKAKLAAVEAANAVSAIPESDSSPAENLLAEPELGTEPILVEELKVEPEPEARQVFAEAGVLRPKPKSEPLPQPTEAERQKVKAMEESGKFPDEIFDSLDWLLALLWVFKNAFTARRCLISPEWDSEKAYPTGAWEREPRIEEIESVRRRIDLDFNPGTEDKIRDEIDELGLLMDQLSMIGFVCFQIHKTNLSQRSTSGGVKLRNQVEFLVRGHQCFERLGRLTYLPAGLPCVQFKYQKPLEAVPPTRRARLESEAKALIKAAEVKTMAKAEAEKRAWLNQGVEEMKAMLVTAGGFSEDAALRLAKRAQKKHSDAPDGREKLIRLALGKLLHATQLSSKDEEDEWAKAKKIAEAAGLNEAEINRRLAAHQAEEARKAVIQQEAAIRAKSNVPTDWRTLSVQQRLHAIGQANGQKKGKRR